MIRVILFAIFVVTVLGSCGHPTFASPPADTLVPSATKAFLSIPDIATFREHWSQTQLGKLLSDPVMRPFADDLQAQLRGKLFSSSLKINVTWDEIAGACGGEFAMGGIQPADDPAAHAGIMIVDVSGHEAQARQVLDKIQQQLVQQGAKRQVTKVGQYELVTYELPRQRGQVNADFVIGFLVEDTLVIGNHEPTCREVMKLRIEGGSQQTLSTVAAYQAVMQRVSAGGQVAKADIRWYLDPFDYAAVVRASQGGLKKRRKDMLAILKSQGFDAVQAIGGHIELMTGEHEMLHRTMIYAPPAGGAGGKYELAARMLDFPNGSDWEWHNWIPRDLSGTTRMNWRVQDAFEHCKSLVDAVAGTEGFFDDLLASIKNDPKGPRVDVKQEFVQFLGDHVTFVSDSVYPVTPKSERVLVAIEVRDEQAVSRTLHRTLVDDPDARRVDVEGFEVWEILDEEDESAPDLDLDIGGIDPIGGFDEEPKEERILRNSAITVAHGQLMVSTHVELLRRILKERDATDQLNKCEDFRQVIEHLNRIGAGEDSMRFFSRTDEAYRPSYELFRDGRMPESESMLGKVLNRLLGPEDEGLLRQPELDGSRLPDFQMVRRYLGPAGTYVRSEENGWYASGVLLNKQAANLEGVTQPAITAGQAKSRR